MNSQTAFVQALLDPGLPCPVGFSTWNGSDPTDRFNVYRNNVAVSLVDALAATFPVTHALVGEDFFRAMARVFVQSHRPRSPIMAYYGSSFPGFVATFEPVSSLPYLADVASLEMARVFAYHAADCDPVDRADFQAALVNPAELAVLTLELHPSVHLINSDFAIFSIWGAHQGSIADASFDPFGAQQVMVYRNGLTVEMHALLPGEARFVSAVQSGENLLAAAEAANAAAVDFDLTRSLATLLGNQLVTKLVSTTKRHETNY